MKRGMYGSRRPTPCRNPLMSPSLLLRRERYSPCAGERTGERGEDRAPERFSFVCSMTAVRERALELAGQVPLHRRRDPVDHLLGRGRGQGLDLQHVAQEREPEQLADGE